MKNKPVLGLLAVVMVAALAWEISTEVGQSFFVTAVAVFGVIAAIIVFSYAVNCRGRSVIDG